MKKNNFLSELNKEKRLELVYPSQEICESYLEKADNCFSSAKLLFNNELYETSVTMSYYNMYNSLIALLFKTGIKCENHAGSILLLKLLFDKIDLFKLISDAKKERIDKQYYVTELDLMEESSEETLTNAENFLVKINLIIKQLSNEETDKFREDFEVMIGKRKPVPSKSSESKK